MAIPFIRKYQPKKTSEIIGQTTAINSLTDMHKSVLKTKKKAVLLYGPSGTGKTASVHALALESDYEILEVNASDLRNKDQLESTVGAAIKQQSLFAKDKIILVDEIDGIAGREDRGGLNAIASLIDMSTYPIILTANNPFGSKFSGVRKKSNLIEFQSLDYRSITNILKNICERESIEYDEESLAALARRAGGDARAAINDFQSASQRSKKITKDTLELETDRNQIESMPSALVRIYKTLQADVARDALESVQENLDEIFLWIEDNTGREYTQPKDLYRAYESIAKADVFKGRIRRRQHWRFMTYISDLLTAGVAISKDEKYKGFSKYMPTMRLLRIWQMNNKNRHKKNIAITVASQVHTSTKRVIQDMIPYFKIASEKNKKFATTFAEHFELEKEQEAWLKDKN